MKLLEQWTEDAADTDYNLPGLGITSMVLEESKHYLYPKDRKRYKYIVFRIQLYKKFYCFNIRLWAIK